MSLTTQFVELGKTVRKSAIDGLQQIREIILQTDSEAEQASLRDKERQIEAAAEKEAALQDQLDQMLGNEGAIEKRRYDAQKKELEALGVAGTRSLEIAEQIHRQKMDDIEIKQKEESKANEIAASEDGTGRGATSSSATAADEAQQKRLAAKAAAEEEDRQLKERAEASVASLKNELDRMLGNEEAIEDRRYAAQQGDLEALGKYSEEAEQLAQAIHDKKVEDRQAELDAEDSKAEADESARVQAAEDAATVEADAATAAAASKEQAEKEAAEAAEARNQAEADRQAASLQDQLDRMLGNETAIEERRYNAQMTELDALGVAGEAARAIALQIHEGKLADIAAQEETELGGVSATSDARKVATDKARAEQTRSIKEASDAAEARARDEGERRKAALQDQLDQLLGNEDAIEERRYKSQIAELESLGEYGEEALKLAKEIHDKKIEDKEAEAEAEAEAAQEAVDAEKQAKLNAAEATKQAGLDAAAAEEQKQKDEAERQQGYLQNQLDQMMGNEATIEERRYQGQVADFEALGEYGLAALELARIIHEKKMEKLGIQSAAETQAAKDITNEAQGAIDDLAGKISSLTEKPITLNIQGSIGGIDADTLLSALEDSRRSSS